MTPNELKRLFPNASRSTILANCGAPSRPECEPNPVDEPVGPAPRAAADPVRRVVCITSYRCGELDQENVFTKYFTDALRYAGILFDDTPTWCEIKTEQKRVSLPSLERTEIVIY